MPPQGSDTKDIFSNKTSAVAYQDALLSIIVTPNTTAPEALGVTASLTVYDAYAPTSMSLPFIVTSAPAPAPGPGESSMVVLGVVAGALTLGTLVLVARKYGLLARIQGSHTQHENSAILLGR